ncbi:MAG: ribosome silencing factor [Planctomycetota bacterium]
MPTTAKRLSESFELNAPSPGNSTLSMTNSDRQDQNDDEIRTDASVGSDAAAEQQELPQSDRMVRRVSDDQIERSLNLARAVVKAAAENRGQDIMLLDLTDQTALFDFFIIASGSSRRQLSAMGQEIDRVLKHEYGEQRMSVAGYEESRWIVLDYGSIVVHLFDEETREFYDLESLWADSKHVDISEIVESASAKMARMKE